MKNLKIQNAEASLDHGFFFVEFEDGRSLQCCLAQGDEGYEMKIDSKDSGFDQGLSYDCNEWAKNEDGEIGHIEEFLFEQAKKEGVEII